MMAQVSRSLLVFLLVILTLACNSSAKHVQIEEFAVNPEDIATLQAPREVPFRIERHIIPPHHPPMAIPPEASVEFQIPMVTPNAHTRSKILTVRPDPGIDYKIVAASPAPGVDYKMLIVPEQGQSPHAIGQLVVPSIPLVPHVPGGPPVPRRPDSQRQDDAK